jgi:hypothetical protein
MGGEIMASQNRVLATADSDNVQLSIDFDDVSLLITTATLTNDGAKGTATITLTSPVNGSVVFGPFSRKVGDAPLVQNVSARNLHMVPFTDKFGNQRLATPFNVSMEWQTTAVAH